MMSDNFNDKKCENCCHLSGKHILFFYRHLPPAADNAGQTV